MERTAVHRAVHRGAPTAFPAPTMRRRATTGRRACSRRLLRGGVQGWSEAKIDVRVGSVRALRKLLRVYSVHWDPSARQGGGHTGGQYDALPSSFMVQ